MYKKIISITWILFITSLCFSQIAFDPEIQKELIIIDSVHNYDLDPHTASYSSEGQLLTALYEGLFMPHPLTLEPTAAIAENFTVSRDKKTWTFSIRSDAKFSDGQRITAYDVKNSWIALLDPNIDAPFASLLDIIVGAEKYRQGKGRVESVGIEVKNRTTLIVTLINPTEYFAKILSHHAFSIVSKNDDVYSGAYVLKERKKNEIIFEKNEFYYDVDEVAIPSIRIINDDDTEENAFRFNTGEVHWVTGGVRIDEIYDTESLYIAPQFGTEFIFFKAHKKPWNNEDLRNAVIAAIPWDAMRTGFVQAETLILPIGEYPAVVGTKERDIELAKDLLKKAGYELKYGSDSKPIPTGLELVFAIPDFEYTREQAQMLVDALAEIGITVLIETSPADRYLGSFDSWDADLFTYTWIGDFADPLAFLELFRSGSTLRETEWTDRRFDALLREANLLEDQAKRYEKLAEAEQYLLDAGVILPISHPISFNVIDTRILAGWYPNAMNLHPFKDMFFIEQKASSDFI